MNKIYLQFIVILFFLLINSCVNKHFKVYSLTEDDNTHEKNYIFSNSSNDFKVIFDRASINKEFVEINIIATDYYYYGQFFFDENFMAMLKSKTMDIGADALLYEKERNDFLNYNENFLYFTAIKYENIK